MEMILDVRAFATGLQSQLWEAKAIRYKRLAAASFGLNLGLLVGIAARSWGWV